MDLQGRNCFGILQYAYSLLCIREDVAMRLAALQLPNIEVNWAGEIVS